MVASISKTPSGRLEVASPKWAAMPLVPDPPPPSGTRWLAGRCNSASSCPGPLEPRAPCGSARPCIPCATRERAPCSPSDSTAAGRLLSDLPCPGTGTGSPGRASHARPIRTTANASVRVRSASHSAQSSDGGASGARPSIRSGSRRSRSFQSAASGFDRPCDAPLHGAWRQPRRRPAATLPSCRAIASAGRERRKCRPDARRRRLPNRRAVASPRGRERATQARARAPPATAETGYC